MSRFLPAITLGRRSEECAIRYRDLGGAAWTQVLTSLRRHHNDLHVVAGANVDPRGFTLLALLRNEIYFLPEFLAHYRSLGVQRFVFLDDRSDDGSFEYLREQPDAVVVESGRTYGDMVEIASSISKATKSVRVMTLWRSLLHDMFAHDRWTLQVDLDEFVHLPEGVTFVDLVERLEKQDTRAVWGVMLDVYPKDIVTLAEQDETARLDPSATWYFDGEQHLQLRRNRRPRLQHPGARARLYRRFGVDKLYPVVETTKRKSIERSLRKSWLGLRPMSYNALHKPILLKWGDNCCFLSSHETNLSGSKDYLLPIQHFRFTGAVYRKIEAGLHDKSYYGGSLDHRLLSELLRTMQARDGSFLYRKSRPLQSFDDFAETRNALGF